MTEEQDEIVVSVRDEFFLSVLDVLEANRIYFCLLGDLALNVYVAPEETKCMELVIDAAQLEAARRALKKQFYIEKLEAFLKVYEKPQSFQARILTQDRYQLFVGRAHLQEVLGCQVPVASLKDVLRSLEWSALDKNTRAPQRQKDLWDISRILAFRPTMDKSLPKMLRKQLAGE